MKCGFLIHFTENLLSGINEKSGERASPFSSRLPPSPADQSCLRSTSVPHRLLPPSPGIRLQLLSSDLPPVLPISLQSPVPSTPRPLATTQQPNA
ncbi:unnamed protein product [Linum trigynum]|uniref:Uncharacterized protein n=1 Tax=Linum trigynum TaxID=586398 RepID=A0AAV2EE65_9ROSI